MRKLERLARITAIGEEQAKAVAARSGAEVRRATRAIDRAEASSADLGHLDPVLGRRLLEVGARHIELLTAERDAAAERARADLVAWQQAKQRHRSTERLIERHEQRRRVEADRKNRAELLDLVTARIPSAKAPAAPR